MKRIKMMLVSFMLFAPIGATLAFIADYDGTFCTAEPNHQGQNVCAKVCPNFTTNVAIGSTGNFVCTASYDDNNCETRPQCANIPPVQLEPTIVLK